MKTARNQELGLPWALPNKRIPIAEQKQTPIDEQLSPDPCLQQTKTVDVVMDVVHALIYWRVDINSISVPWYSWSIPMPIDIVVDSSAVPVSMVALGRDLEGGELHNPNHPLILVEQPVTGI
jgi:hypothetical protein